MNGNNIIFEVTNADKRAIFKISDEISIIDAGGKCASVEKINEKLNRDKSI